MRKLALLGLLASTPAFAALLINGAGATFPYPLYSKWFSEYHRMHPELELNYQSIGSGGGVKQITEKTVDFGASDAPMTDAEMARAAGVLHIPTVLGAVAVAYSLEGVPGLKLSPQALSAIFLGKATKWNDPLIAADNPGVNLPATDIAVAHRSDGSGTTAIFTDYLAKVSPEWKASVGAGKSVKWPVGMGGKGNEGVTGVLTQTPGSIGYVELAYANQNHMAVAKLRNKAGQWVAPTLDGVSAAAAGAAIPADYRVSITDASGPTSYPISAFTYLLVYKDAADPAKGQAMAAFLAWAVHDGQKLAPALDYAPLPPGVVSQVDATLKSLTAQGKPALGNVR